MRRRRIPLRDVRLEVGGRVVLEDETSHYLVTVLRLECNAEIELFDGSGRSFLGRLVALDPATVIIERELETSTESPCSITLYQAIAKADHFDLVVEKATELGVHAVVPIETARTVVRLDASKAAKRLARWERIAESAARQSGRSAIPDIRAPLSLEEAMRLPRHPLELLFHADGGRRSLSDLVPGDAGEVALWVGPEGGFEDDEVTRLKARASLVSLGPRILRSETAGIVAVALVQLLTGGLE